MLHEIYSAYLTPPDVEMILFNSVREILGRPFSFYLDENFAWIKNSEDTEPLFFMDLGLLGQIQQEHGFSVLRQYVMDHYPRSCFRVYKDMADLYTKSISYPLNVEALGKVLKGEFIQNESTGSFFRLEHPSMLRFTLEDLWKGRRNLYESFPPIPCGGEITMPFLGKSLINKVYFRPVMDEDGVIARITLGLYYPTQMEIADMTRNYFSG